MLARVTRAVIAIVISDPDTTGMIRCFTYSTGPALRSPIPAAGKTFN